jgi:hypothetical protein
LQDCASPIDWKIAYHFRQLLFWVHCESRTLICRPLEDLSILILTDS